VKLKYLKIKFVLTFSFFWLNGFGQQVKLTNIGTCHSKGDSNAIYTVEIFNNTNAPICIPVSLSFGSIVNLADTVEVTNIYPSTDSAVVFSLYYSKSDLEESSMRYPAVPIIINPNTYFLTNIKFNKPQRKKVYLELNFSFDKNLDFQKIRSSFENEPKYRWMNDLNFIEKKYLLF
jgi:hypothetical protein